MAANERLSAALIGGLLSDSADVAICQNQLHDTFSRVVASAFDDEIAPADRTRIIRTLEHVWFSGLIGWRNDWMPIAQAISELEDAARLLVPGRVD